MKNLKQLSVITLCLILLALSFASCIETETSKAGTDGLDYYPLPDGTWGVSMGKTQFLEEVVIPTTHEGKKVTQVLLDGFKNAVNLKRIQIQSSVTTIGAGAFSGCTSLTEFVIPSTVTSIGADALSGCTGLTDLTLPFLGASPDDTKNGKLSYLFGDSIPSALTTVTLTGGTVIGAEAFANCEKLETVNLPDGITSIGAEAFADCYQLKRLVLPESVKSIGGKAFYYCRELTEVNIPNGVTSIGSATFSGCRSLTSVILPDSVSSIRSDAFYDCTSLTCLVLPKTFSTATVGSSLLSLKTTSIRTLYYSGTEADWEKVAGRVSLKPDTVVYYYSAERPTSGGFYWRFVGDQIPAPW